MKSIRAAVLFSLGLFLSNVALSRTWIDNTGKEIEAEFVKYDATGQMVTIKKAERIYAVALKILSENDQKWVKEQVSAQEETQKQETEAKEKEVQSKGKEDQIFLMLNKTSKEVAEAIKDLNMVEDLGSLKSQVTIWHPEETEGLWQGYDSGKLVFMYKQDKLATIELYLNKGYNKAMPLGLKKDIDQIVATEILVNQDFELFESGYMTDWDDGDDLPGWGKAHRLKSSPSKVVAIMTRKGTSSKELAIIRIMQK